MKPLVAKLRQLFAFTEMNEQSRRQFIEGFKAGHIESDISEESQSEWYELGVLQREVANLSSMTMKNINMD
ncbi:MAG: hypothetical protein AAF171_15585 [Cyanobacteria bacterium P01_A01_bin.116]